MNQCGNCALWDRVTSHGRGTTTGYCASSLQGKITRSDDHCPMHIKSGGLGFDENAAIDDFNRVRAGKVVDSQGRAKQVFHYRAQNQVDTDELRRRSARARRVA